MNKIDLLKEFEGTLYHNLLCYSENYLMNKPKEKFVDEWKDTKEKINLLKKIIEDEQQKESSENMSFTKEQILKKYPKVQYHVINSNGGLLAGTVELEDAKKYAEQYKREYLNDSLNNHLGVYVYDKEGKNIYVAKGIQNNVKEEKKEEEEFE